MGGRVVEGRIFFPGNPWPQGHRIIDFKWTAAINPQWGVYGDTAPALTLGFDLKTADYYDDDGTHLVARDAEDDDTPDWASKTCWNNFHACSIGDSATSSRAGLPVSDGTQPFEFGRDEYRFKADPLPVDFDDFFDTCAFGVYLLGHDAVADHDIHLKRGDDGLYSIDWTGKIALAYGGHEEFDYGFHARITGVTFDAMSLFYYDPVIAKEHLGLEVDPSITPRDFIAPYVTDPDQFRFEKRNDVLYAVRIR